MDRIATVTGDPAGVVRAAGVLGRLVGRGLLSVAECAAPLAAAGRAAAPGRDAAGLRTRLLHRLADAAQAEDAARGRAVAAIRAAVRPGLLAGARSAALRAAARAANGGVLSAAEVDAVAAGAIAAMLGRRHAG